MRGPGAGTGRGGSVAFITHGWTHISTGRATGRDGVQGMLRILFPVLILLLSQAALADAETLHNLGNGICVDTSSGLMWQIGHSRRLRDADKVQQYIRDLSLGGFTDWRLPTTAESKGLRLLIDIHGNGACGIEQPRKRYWMLDQQKGVIPIRLELESFCRGIYSSSPGNRGSGPCAILKSE